jgi:hypothetical protein
MIKIKHGMSADSGDIITCARFNFHRFGGLGSGVGQIQVFVFPQ